MADEQVRIAREKFACPACGGEAVWNPAKQKLVCPFCGTESPAKIDTAGNIIEHDLVAALRGIDDGARGWQAERRQVKCQSCNAISVLDPARQAQKSLTGRSHAEEGRAAPRRSAAPAEA